MAYDNTNRMAAFINDKKTTDKHPDFKGTINIEGKEYWISVWKKFTAKGEMLSGSVQVKEEKPKETKPEDDFDNPPF